MDSPLQTTPPSGVSQLAYFFMRLNFLFEFSVSYLSPETPTDDYVKSVNVYNSNNSTLFEFTNKKACQITRLLNTFVSLYP